jgi:hypothetical protein
MPHVFIAAISKPTAHFNPEILPARFLTGLVSCVVSAVCLLSWNDSIGVRSSPGAAMSDGLERWKIHAATIQLRMGWSAAFMPLHRGNCDTAGFF